MPGIPGVLGAPGIPGVPALGMPDDEDDGGEEEDDGVEGIDGFDGMDDGLLGDELVEGMDGELGDELVDGIDGMLEGLGMLGLGILELDDEELAHAWTPAANIRARTIFPGFMAAGLPF